MVIPWESLGVGVMALLLGFGEAYRRGIGFFSRFKRNRKVRTNGSGASYPHMMEKIDTLQETVERVDHNVDELHRTVAHLHRDELRDSPLARERLNVTSDDDLLDD